MRYARTSLEASFREHLNWDNSPPFTTSQATVNGPAGGATGCRCLESGYGGLKIFESLMADESLLNKVHELSDLELATLICLVAQEHCIIDTDPEVLDDLVTELQLVSLFSKLWLTYSTNTLQVASNVFGLTHAVVDCSEHTSLDDFAHAILSVEGPPPSPARTRAEYFIPTPTFTSISRSPVSESFADNKTIANVIIAKNIDEAPKQVQIQALELMRTKRIYTRTSVQSAPKRFLFVCLLAGGEGPRLTKHLNEYIFLSHFHDPEDGLPNLEEMYDDGKSISSVVKKSPTLLPESIEPRISAAVRTKPVVLFQT